MISLFSRIMDNAVDAHFRKDPSGRLVFIPFTSKGKTYFVDSKSDEEKIRSCVKMFRSAITLIYLLTFPSLFVPEFVLEAYAGLSPRRHRLEIVLGILVVFLVCPCRVGVDALGRLQRSSSGFNGLPERGRT